MKMWTDELSTFDSVSKHLFQVGRNDEKLYSPLLSYGAFFSIPIMFSYRQNASGQTLLRQLRRLQYPTVQRPLWPSYQHPLRRSSIQSLLSRFLFSSCVFFLWADKKLHCFRNKKLLPRYNIWIFKKQTSTGIRFNQFRSTPPVSTINSFKSRGVPPGLQHGISQDILSLSTVDHGVYPTSHHNWSMSHNHEALRFSATTV